ncbi:MAG: sugar ABC transporter permease [Limnochordia bacterium]|nr:sugar ABC transporter permease [Bacillota bacterium]HOB08059.1 sugar ABC transporter permease [Limnochordia bacterium]HPT92468.1 sugar ABC transporter permease [Limnochordia bacterium]HPZ30246.1 sugar ABC transporter permease [Limnochordia bacterium]HQD70224.1 sugar ABC transporter permease [Limnochordia bacterium]
MSSVVSRRRMVSPGIEYRESLWARMKKSWRSYAFVGPFLFLFTVFTVVPVILSIVLSFTYFNMLEFPKWIGWANYIRLFLADEVFLIAVKNTLLFAAITGPVSYMMCFIFAWFINELQPKVRAFLTLLFYAPSISGSAYTIWQFIFSQDTYGYINAHLLNLNIVDKPIGWLIEPKYMMTIVIIVTLWMSLGTSFLAFIAGLQGISSTLYEAGAIDGIKNRWQELWYLTLPAMRPYLMFGAIMAITGSFNAAGNIQALTGPNPTDYATWTVMQHLNDYGTVRYEMGYASAISVVLFFVMVGSQRLVQRMLHRIGN